MSDVERVTAIRQRAEAATEGPWPTPEEAGDPYDARIPERLLLQALREEVARLTRRIEDLERPGQPLGPAAPSLDPTARCPCRPENGGSGVCGCVLGSGSQVWC
jgi:hypothetical protein